MNFSINKHLGATCFNVTLLPTRIQTIFTLGDLDEQLSKYTEVELSDMEAFLLSKADENVAIAALTEEPNEHGLSTSSRRQWEAKCIANTCAQAAAGVRRFNRLRKNPHLKG